MTKSQPHVNYNRKQPTASRRYRAFDFVVCHLPFAIFNLPSSILLRRLPYLRRPLRNPVRGEIFVAPDKALECARLAGAFDYTFIQSAPAIVAPLVLDVPTLLFSFPTSALFDLPGLIPSAHRRSWELRNISINWNIPRISPGK